MRLRNRLARQDGFSLVAVLGFLMVGTMLATAAFAAVSDDMPFARAAQDRKQAYAAAEAGLNYYEAQLRRDNEFWRTCAPTGTPINQAWNGTGSDPRTWRSVPSSDGKFTIEVMPANGAASCNPAQPEATMLDASTSTFRIRSTGKAGNSKRSILATFRQKGFLDFLYLTDYETQDPASYATQSQRDAAQRDCVRPRESRPSTCTEITFTDRDVINGPFHTNDDIQICGTPTFGRAGHAPPDDIEITGVTSTRSYYVNECSGTPDIRGRLIHPAGELKMPPSNDQLRTLALPAYRLSGSVDLFLNGTTMQTRPHGTTTWGAPMAMPSNGVIWGDQGASCSGIATPLVQNYTDDPGCPIIYVSGNTSRSLTIASAGDIVITGDLGHSSDSMLGLIALNYVRVYHPVSPRPRSTASCTSSASGTMANVTINAAILTLQHSFIVDNYACGGAQNVLNVTGAIAQKFRGPVGTFNSNTGQTASGYTKNYVYDDVLKLRTPPYFLNPLSAPWRVVRTNEQVPAR
jgi:Tfp pilus assembly protein PilX